ncbi:hypothetical protein F4820DRAFT_254571 [Hypoxylon rubiginosum]|uniref:Uncharacterized protein n=1 Tax=Hypoxylon rubiginosum TaxID=110542 RepID=A0ACB9ZHF8_9PEZI|nr:hypothetical protein F4820DRAFT_254571 [Hypoxylon rubiginosum]
MSAHGSSSTGSKTSTGMASQVKTPANAGIGEDKPKMFDAQGSIGKQFTEGGAIGGAAQKVGGPLDKDGMIGKQFNPDGSIGGSVQSTLGGKGGRSN